MQVQVLTARPAFNGQPDNHGNIAQWVTISATDPDTGQPIDGMLRSKRGYKPGDTLDATWEIVTSKGGKQYTAIRRVHTPDGAPISGHPEFKNPTPGGPSRVKPQEVQQAAGIPRMDSDEMLNLLAHLHLRSFQFCFKLLSETEMNQAETQRIAAEWASSDARQVMMGIERGTISRAIPPPADLEEAPF